MPKINLTKLLLGMWLREPNIKELKVKSSQQNPEPRKSKVNTLSSHSFSHKDMDSHCLLRFRFACFVLFASVACCFSHPSLLGIHPLGRSSCPPFASKHQSLDLFPSGSSTQVTRCSSHKTIFALICMYILIILMNLELGFGCRWEILQLWDDQVQGWIEILLQRPSEWQFLWLPWWHWWAWYVCRMMNFMAVLFPIYR